MLLAASRRRFLRRYLPSFALLAGAAPSALLARPLIDDPEGSIALPLRRPGADDGADLVLVDGWILRRSDLEHLR